MEPGGISLGVMEPGEKEELPTGIGNLNLPRHGQRCDLLNGNNP